MLPRLFVRGVFTFTLLTILILRTIFFLLLLLLLAKIIKFLSNIQDIIKGLGVCDFVDKNSFFLIEIDINKTTNLEIKVCFVGKIHDVQIFIGNLEEVFFGKFRISTIKSLGDASISTLHQFLNADILNHIHNLWWNLSFFNPVKIRCIECMTNFMTHEHIINRTACLFPHRQSQNPSVDIKASGLNLLVLYNQIFGCQQFSKLGFDLVGNSHRSSFVWTHNTTNPAFWTGSCDAFSIV